MNLLILPGGGDPNHSSSMKSISLLKTEAAKRLFNNVIISTYLGHFSHPQKGKLEIRTTKSEMLFQLKKMDELNDKFIVFVRSYGCNPLLELLVKNQRDFRNLKKVIIWGASNYWHEIPDEKISDVIYYVKEEKGGLMSSSIFSEIIPIENTLPQINNINYPIIFCTGTLDKHSPLSFYTHLKKLSNSSNVYFAKLIENEGHTIEYYNKEYLDLILN